MTDMTTETRKPLDYYLGLQYSFNVIADPDGGFVIVFPDLPGCMSQVENLGEIPSVAEEIRALWIETMYEDEEDIPLPSYPEVYSGKFNLRVPKSLHRTLTEGADRQGISLNQYVVSLLSGRDADARAMRELEQLRIQIKAMEDRIGARLDRVEAQVGALETHFHYRFSGSLTTTSSIHKLRTRVAA